MDSYIIAEALKSIDRRLVEQNSLLRELIETLERSTGQCQQ